MEPTKTHSVNFPVFDNYYFNKAEQALNFCSCIPTPLAQKITAMIHSTIGAAQMFAGIHLLWHGNQWKIQAKHAVLRNKMSEEEVHMYQQAKAMRSSGNGHLVDGIENTIRGSIGWALGKYGMSRMQHFPGRTKVIPGAIGGLTLLAVNLYFPAIPFGQVNRGWRSEDSKSNDH